MRKRWLLSPVVVLLLLMNSNSGFCQRTYAPHSVLSSGTWIKIGITASGVYRLDASVLNRAGLPATGAPTSSLRLYGNGGGMLPENNRIAVPDDLVENALVVVDGGDGTFDGNDYLLFYGNGPLQWRMNPANQQFEHQFNLYSDTTYYFMTLGGTGKRIPKQASTLPPTVSFNSYIDHYVHELDTFNLLSSGKEWFGEEFMQAPGKVMERSFAFPTLPAVAGPAIVSLKAVARSFGGPSTFTITDGGSDILQLPIAPVATGPYDQFARIDSATAPLSLTEGTSKLTIRFTPAAVNSQGWLDWFELLVERRLDMNGLTVLPFRNTRSLAPGAVAQYQLGKTSQDLIAWNVTDPANPIDLALSRETGSMSFTDRHDSLQEYIAFRPEQVPVPFVIGKVQNQDLHGGVPATMLVVTHPPFLDQANRLAAFHRSHDSIAVNVVTTDMIYNEFSSGVPDPAAIRNFVKMYYDRAGGDSTRRPKYLLLFGDASFDYKNRVAENTSFVPAFETRQSLDPLSTYTSDDFFGFLDDDDDINGTRLNLLDIGIGRLPASSRGEAMAIVDKIIRYHQPAAIGPWRNEFSFIADDEDANLHLSDAELITSGVDRRAPEFNIEKIYLDAFQQQSSAGGGTYPEVNSLVLNRMNTGNLIWNYSGHGGYRRLAEEVVLDQGVIDQFKNADRLPLFITATCDVAPYDNPLVRSIGENLLLRPNTGAIALMTTTRLVFAFSNRVMNDNYLSIALRRDNDSNYLSLGEASRLTKNFTYQFSGDIINNRKFTLLGDPAIRLAFPEYEVVTTLVNGRPIGTDTLKAMSKYTIEGEVRDRSGRRLDQFTGSVFPELFDKPTKRRTLGNDPGSIATDFEVRENRVYKGKVTVQNGRFQYTFVVPRDINYLPGPSRVRYYAASGISDGNGVDQRLIIGGTGDSLADREPPQIRLYLNDERFVSGSITNENPVLIAKLVDSSGINIIGNGVGHDLLVTIDNDPKQQFAVNQFYQSELDSYQKGALRFQLPRLEEGFHTLTLKAWDVMNNPAVATLDFRVYKESGLTLDHVLNYPNPFTTRTNFWFEHNRPGEELNVQVQVYTVTGKLVKTLRNTIITTGNRSIEVEWDGRDDYGNKLGRGVYIYNLRVQTTDGKMAQKLQKLYLL